MDAALAIEARFRRQRRPADIILARTPRDPGRRPFFSRHPNPADAAQFHPTAVVIGRPPKRFVRDPRPTGIAVNPVAFRVRPPIARALRFARLENVTVVLRFSPFTVGIELLVKHSVGRSRTRFGTAFSIASFGDNFFRWRSGWFFDDGRRARRRGDFSISEGFLARCEFCLLFCDGILVRGQAFRREPVLYLAFDFGFSFLFGRLLLTGNKNRQGRDQRENGKLLHVVVRPSAAWVIRISLVETETPAILKSE